MQRAGVAIAVMLCSWHSSASASVAAWAQACLFSKQRAGAATNADVC